MYDVVVEERKRRREDIKLNKKEFSQKNRQINS